MADEHRADVTCPVIDSRAALRALAAHRAVHRRTRRSGGSRLRRQTFLGDITEVNSHYQRLHRSNINRSQLPHFCSFTAVNQTSRSDPYVNNAISIARTAARVAHAAQFNACRSHAARLQALRLQTHWHVAMFTPNLPLTGKVNFAHPSASAPRPLPELPYQSLPVHAHDPSHPPARDLRPRPPAPPCW